MLICVFFRSLPQKRSPKSPFIHKYCYMKSDSMLDYSVRIRKPLEPFLVVRSHSGSWYILKGRHHCQWAKHLHLIKTVKFQKCCYTSKKNRLNGFMANKMFWLSVCFTRPLAVGFTRPLTVCFTRPLTVCFNRPLTSHLKSYMKPNVS